MKRETEKEIIEGNRLVFAFMSTAFIMKKTGLTKISFSADEFMEFAKKFKTGEVDLNMTPDPKTNDMVFTLIEKEGMLWNLIKKS